MSFATRYFFVKCANTKFGCSISLHVASISDAGCQNAVPTSGV